MNENLLPLKDFHLPPEPGIWPLAPGWWVLLILVIFAIATIVWLVQRHRRKLRCDYRREARLQLNHMVQTFELDGDLQALSMNVNRLLKRVALNAIGPRAARLTDDAWIRFLNDQLAPNEALLDEPAKVLLSKQPYTCSALLASPQIDQALNNVKHWIDKHQGELLNVNL